jgi:hypothetical protein
MNTYQKDTLLNAGNNTFSPTVKTCTKCLQEKQESEFTWKVKGKRRNAKCRSCYSEYNKANSKDQSEKRKLWNQKNPEKLALQKKRRNTKWIEPSKEKIEQLKGVCANYAFKAGFPQLEQELISDCMMELGTNGSYNLKYRMVDVIRTAYGYLGRSESEDIVTRARRHMLQAVTELSDADNTSKEAVVSVPNMQDKDFEFQELAEVIHKKIKKKWTSTHYGSTYYLMAIHGLNQDEVSKALDLTPGRVNQILKSIQEFVQRLKIIS